MRLTGRDGIARALYVTAIGRRVVVVRAFLKKTQKTPRAEIDLALQHAKGNPMTIQFEKLKARLLANPRVKAESGALEPEFEIAAELLSCTPARGPLPGRTRSANGHQPIHHRPARKWPHAAEHQDAAALR